MNYQKKSEEVFVELFHKSWMKENDWNAFKKRASKIYPMEDFASDLETGYPWTSIDAKLNEIKKIVKV